ncbi:hypothetical protein D3C86_1321980 [compost metagenome]
MAQRSDQHRPGVVVFEPARIGGEHAALLDGITELEKTVVGHFQHANHAKFVLHLGEQMLDALLSHLVFRLSAAKPRLSAKRREQVTH